jgi:hypothetical protein
MTVFLLTLVGLAFIDSLNVLNIGIVSTVVYGSRLHRHSALPAGLSYIAGVLVAIVIFGLCAVLGLGLLTDLPSVTLAPAVRYWGEFLLGWC